MFHVLNRIMFAPVLLVFATSPMIASDQIATVEVELGTRLETNGHSQFDRRKFINVHSSIFDKDWNGRIAQLKYLVEDLDVYFARDSGEVSWVLSQMREDPKRTGFVEFNLLQDYCQKLQARHFDRSELRTFFSHEDQVATAQLIPTWPKSRKITPPDGSNPWKVASPEAAGEYMAYWLNMARSAKGVPRPKYIELLNEPLYELKREGIEATPQDVFDFHRRAATQIRKYCPETKWGGYTCAFPDIENDDFGEWKQTWKRFIDTVGDDIDFYSLHLYDFPGINNGQQMYRKGCQLEATLDTIEHYATSKFGKPKPFLISEYGSQLHDWYAEPWSSKRDWLCIKATNSMMLQFLDRPDQVVKAVPFVPALAEWGFDKKRNVPYQWRLLRRSNEPQSYSGKPVFTDLVKLYEFWKGVKGYRAIARSSDQRLLTDVYVSNRNTFVLINNLSPRPVTLDVRGLSEHANISKLIARHIYFHNNKVQLDERYITPSSDPLVVGPEATLMLIGTLTQPITVVRRITRQKHFAMTQFQSIRADQPLVFEIKDVPKAVVGESKLRLAIGRPHGLSLRPIVTVNGTPVAALAAYRGPEQTDRPSFFGVLEVPVPNRLLAESNTVRIRFTDNGGKVSSVSLVCAKPASTE